MNFLYYQHLISHSKAQLLAEFKKILYVGFKATLNFRKFRVALNPSYKMFLNFAKSCVLPCLLNIDNIKKIQCRFCHKNMNEFPSCEKKVASVGPAKSFHWHAFRGVECPAELYTDQIWDCHIHNVVIGPYLQVWSLDESCNQKKVPFDCLKANHW